MKLLIMTGPLYPQLGNNANLTAKLIPQFIAAGHEVHLFAAAFGVSQNDLPQECLGVPVHWAKDQIRDWKRKFLYPAISKMSDRGGFSDALQVQILMRELDEVCKEFPFEAVLSTAEPFTMACVASQLYGGKKALYIMDPPAGVIRGTENSYRNRLLPSMIQKQDALFSTPFILDGLKAQGYSLPQKTEAIGFPLITDHQTAGKKKNDDKIRVLFCGWLYSGIRSPEYFLDIVSRLDERFEVTFMGRECDHLQEQFPTNSKATIITFPNQPYIVAQKAMANADILINIGNSLPVHMPSKTLEYINTGKPIVNFYKLANCPTLYYTKRFPLALNLFEKEKDLDVAAAQFVRFCEENVGKIIDHNWIETEFADCTPRYIAQKILDSLEK